MENNINDLFNHLSRDAERLGNSLNQIMKQFPKHLEDVKKNASEQDKEAIDKALKQAKFEESMKEFKTAKNNLQDILKK